MEDASGIKAYISEFTGTQGCFATLEALYIVNTWGELDV